MASILVADDELGFRKLLRKVLEEAGHLVLEADNGNQALVIFRKSPPDLVITDIIMPDRDGIETIAIMKGERPSIKVLAISGGGRAHAMDLLSIAPRAGADAILGKPFRKADLLAKVASLLDDMECAPSVG